MADFTLLGISGSLRKGSCNRKLVWEAGRVFGASEFVEADLRLPLYDGDLEAEGMPEPVTRLASEIAEADAVLISTPEYNKNLSGVLKNALDWVSRTEGNPWADKPVAVMSAAAGRAGGERATSSLVLALMPFRPRLVFGPEVLIANCREAFDDRGQLTDARSSKGLGELMGRLRTELGG